MPADQLTDLQQTLSGLRDILGSQTRLIDLCLHRLKEMQDGTVPLPKGVSSKVLDVTLTMIHATGVSAHSILRLTEQIALQARDGYPIARSIVEGVINIGFIMAEGESAGMTARRRIAIGHPMTITTAASQDDRPTPSRLSAPLDRGVRSWEYRCHRSV